MPSVSGRSGCGTGKGSDRACGDRSPPWCSPWSVFPKRQAGGCFIANVQKPVSSSFVRPRLGLVLRILGPTPDVGGGSAVAEGGLGACASYTGVS